MFLEIILWFVFIGSAIVLSVVILLQESKGGGLAEAFGGMGAQTFGVKSGGINKFTSYVAVVFLLSAVLITCVRKSSTSMGEYLGDDASTPPVQEAPVDPGAGGPGTDAGQNK